MSTASSINRDLAMGANLWFRTGLSSAASSKSSWKPSPSRFMESSSSVFTASASSASLWMFATEHAQIFTSPSFDRSLHRTPQASSKRPCLRHSPLVFRMHIRQRKMASTTVHSTHRNISHSHNPSHLHFNLHQSASNKLHHNPGRTALNLSGHSRSKNTSQLRLASSSTLPFQSQVLMPVLSSAQAFRRSR